MFLVLCLGLNGAAAAATGLRQVGPVVPFYTTPTRVDFCGTPVPLERSDVWERFDREFTIVVYSQAQVYLWLKRMERYLPWMEQQLKEYGLPEDLKYVAVAESDLLFYARSPASAAGIWQFIPSTGKRYGLKNSKGIDERYDFEKATRSALQYLKDLHGLFHDWALALAAYNCGENRVQKEIARQNVRDYYALKLPLETERYVLRILAIKTVLENPERYGYYLPEGAGYPAFDMDRVHVLFKTAIPVQRVADAAGMTYRDFKLHNPAYRFSEIPAGSHFFRVPKGTGERAEKNLTELAAKYKPKYTQPKYVVHRVKKGDNLSKIARHYGVSTSDIKRWNHLRGNTIRIGQRLKIYNH